MWLSLVERCVRDAEVAGSNPVIPTTELNLTDRFVTSRTASVFFLCPIFVPYAMAGESFAIASAYLARTLSIPSLIVR